MAAFVICDAATITTVDGRDLVTSKTQFLSISGWTTFRPNAVEFTAPADAQAWVDDMRRRHSGVLRDRPTKIVNAPMIADNMDIRGKVLPESDPFRDDDGPTLRDIIPGMTF